MSNYHKYLKYREKYLQLAGRCSAFNTDDCAVNQDSGYCHQVELGQGDNHCVCNFTTERCVRNDLLPGTLTRLEDISNQAKANAKAKSR
jgi:hypothetical protein